MDCVYKDLQIDGLTTHRVRHAPTTKDAGRLEARLTLLASHPHCRGHFETFPVLPAVSQIELVGALLRHALRGPVTIHTVQKTKFMALLQPGTPVRVTVDFDAQSARWSIVQD